MALRMLSRFVVLLALYTSVMFVGNMHFRQDDIRLTGQHVRTLVAAMQVLIVTALLSVHALFMFFIRVVKHERTSFVLVSNRPVFQIDDADAQELAAEAQPEPPSTEPGSRPAKQPKDSADECNSVRVDAHSESLSMASDPLPLQIVFDNSVNLDLYFLYVTFVGLVLWSTFISFNFATYDSNFVVTSGMVAGWVCNMLSKECRCHESRTPVVPGEKLRTLFYASMSVLIMALGCVSWRVPPDMQSPAAFNFYGPAFCSGLFWTALGHEVAFTGVQNLHASKGILYDTRRSLPTFLLVVTVSALCCSPETSASVLDYIAGLSRLAAVHLLLVEPVLIFLSLYIMIIALEKQRSTDFGLVLVLVEGVYIAYRRETYDATVITTIAASVLLFAAHAGHLLRA